MAKTRAVPKYRPIAAPKPASPERRHFRLDESMAVMSAWVWRAFLMMALVMVGLTINFAVQHYSPLLVGAWGLITVTWFAFSMYLWRQHTRWTNGEIGRAPLIR